MCEFPFFIKHILFTFNLSLFTNSQTLFPPNCFFTLCHINCVLSYIHFQSIFSLAFFFSCPELFPHFAFLCIVSFGCSQLLMILLFGFTVLFLLFSKCQLYISLCNDFGYSFKFMSGKYKFGLGWFSFFPYSYVNVLSFTSTFGMLTVTLSCCVCYDA